MTCDRIGSRAIYWLVVSWLGGLGILLLTAWLTSVDQSNEPGMQDAIGFGGMLLMATLVNVPLFYLPLLWLTRKFSGWIKPMLLVIVGNIPIYILLLIQYKGRMTLPELWLFLAGIVAAAVIFGSFFSFTDAKLSQRAA